MNAATLTTTAMPTPRNLILRPARFIIRRWVSLQSFRFVNSPMLIHSRTVGK